MANFSKKVKVKFDPELDKGYFEEDQIASRVEIVTINDDKLDKLVYIPSGDPRNPLTQEEIENKFRNQAADTLNEEDISRAINMHNHFDKLDNITDLTAILSGE